jgi:lipopolysaccharide export system permease protein
MDMLLDLLDLLISKGIQLWIVTQLFVLALGWMVALSIPCGVLVSALMTYGRLSQDNEIIALRASGVHLMKVMLPALWASVIVAIVLGLFNNYVLPESNFAYASLMQRISRERPTAEIREGVMIDDFRGYDLWIGGLDDRTGEMRDVLILDSRARPDSPRTILARTGTVVYAPEENRLTLHLRDGEVHEADPLSPTGEYRRLRFGAQTLSISDPADRWRGDLRHQRSQREMSIPMMQREVSRLLRDRVVLDSLLAEAMAAASIARVEELDRLSPASRPLTFKGILAAAAGRIRGRLEPEPREPEDPAQRRRLEQARVRRDEQLALTRKISEYRVEIQKKLSIPVACVVFVLVGAPLGMLARRGGLAAGFFSAVFFIFYYLCLIGGEQLADRLLLSPWLAMWLPNLALGTLGIYLTFRAVVSGQPARPQRRKTT